VHIGVLLQEGFQRSGHHAQPQRRRARQPQHAGAAAAHRRHAVFDALQAREVALDRIEQVLRLTRGAQAPPLQIEQLHAAGLLRLRQQAADRRLRGVQHLRGARGGAGQHHGAEGFNLAKVQGPAHRRSTYSNLA